MEEQGASRRAHVLKAAARRPDLLQHLEPPECEPDLFYLWDWALELVGRSGSDMGGLAPLTYSTIAAWAALTDRVVQPWEVRALVLLDGVLRHPGTLDAEG